MVTHCFNRKSGSLTASFFPEPTLEICLARLFFGLSRGDSHGIILGCFLSAVIFFVNVYLCQPLLKVVCQDSHG